MDQRVEQAVAPNKSSWILFVLFVSVLIVGGTVLYSFVFGWPGQDVMPDQSSGGTVPMEGTAQKFFQEVFVGTWEGATRIEYGEPSVPEGAMTTESKTVYSASGEYTSESKISFHSNEAAGVQTLSYLKKERGEWSIEEDGQNKRVLYRPGHIDLVAVNDLARLDAQHNPGKLQQWRRVLSQNYALDILELTQKELRTWDPELGIEVVEKRTK